MCMVGIVVSNVFFFFLKTTNIYTCYNFDAMIEKSIFENAGLKIEKDRVLTYSKLSCPLDCTYCFVRRLEFQSRKEC